MAQEWITAGIKCPNQLTVWYYVLICFPYPAAPACSVGRPLGYIAPGYCCLLQTVAGRFAG